MQQNEVSSIFLRSKEREDRENNNARFNACFSEMKRVNFKTFRLYSCWGRAEFVIYVRENQKDFE